MRFFGRNSKIGDLNAGGYQRMSEAQAMKIIRVRVIAHSMADNSHKTGPESQVSMLR